MPQNKPISFPAGYVQAIAMGYSDDASNLTLISDAEPLPVRLQEGSGTPVTPLTGETSSSTTVGPFDAQTGLPISVTLSGQWTGSAALLRSVDGGVTKSPLLAGNQPWANFTRNGSEQVWVESEQNASFYLDIALTFGTLTYRVSQ